MIRVAICGNIACGKSLVQEFIEDSGYKVLDSDCIAHDLLKRHTNEIVSLFFEYDIVDGENNISREKLGKLIFSNAELKTKLEQFMHPKIREEIEKFFSINSAASLLFVGIPLLFEAGMTDLFDKIIFIYADDEIRLKRLITRNNYSAEYAQIRINSQIPQEEKLSKCDYIIKNNQSKEILKSKISELLEILLAANIK